jgi:RND family efflux transporter MFP subunit
VSFRNAESGVFVGTSTVAFMVIDDSYMTADVPVSQLIVGLVKPNMKIQASVGSPLNENFESVIEWISPGTDPRTQLYSLRIKFLDSGRKLRSGMIARLMIPSGKVEAAILVPEQATFSVTGGDAVYVMADGKVTLRRIELGESDGSDVAVLSGLSKGEMVVTEGQEFLKDGDPVQLP